MTINLLMTIKILPPDKMENLRLLGAAINGTTITEL